MRFSIKITTTPNTPATIAYTSSANDVATVGTNGLVTLVSVGSATITGKTHNNIRAKLTLTVVA